LESARDADGKAEPRDRAAARLNIKVAVTGEHREVVRQQSRRAIAPTAAIPSTRSMSIWSGHHQARDLLDEPLQEALDTAWSSPASERGPWPLTRIRPVESCIRCESGSDAR